MDTLLTVESLTYGTAGIAHLPEGKAVFIDGTAPGDVVRVEIDEEKRSFARAHVVELIEKGPSRVAPACPLAGRCGGCSWQHIAYEEQLAAKRANTVSALTRIGHFDAAFAEGIVDACVPAKKQFGYRNKLELTCTRDAQGRFTVGMMGEGSHDVVSLDTCPLAHKAIAKAPKALRGALRYLEGSQDLGIYRIGVRHSARTNATEIALWTRPGAFPRAAVAKTLSSALRATSIVRVLADPGSERKIKGVEVLAGAGHWREQLGEFEFRVSAPSFFQVNTAQAETLVERTLDGLQLTEDMRVADLYCGVGTFTLPVADLVADTIAVESAGSSVRDLRRNAEDAGVWVDVLGGDSARELAAIGHLDALIVDPPRSGLADGVPADIAAAMPERVAYVSCNPTTWARDAARLDDCGYQLERVTPVDLFPQTYHNELVSIFSRR